jgi:hypothetical protein
MDEWEQYRRNQEKARIDEEQRELANNHDLIDNFKQFATGRGVPAEDMRFSYDFRFGIFASYPDIVRFLQPELGTN